jgi:acyl-CoA synthetase (AMP-forming)/AMP-acid ligase II
MDYVFGLAEKTNIKDCHSFGLFSSMATDLGNTIIFSSLLTGGMLHVFSEKELLDIDSLQEHRIDCLKIVPSHWNAIQTAESLFLPQKCLIFGGEKLRAQRLDEVLKNTACEVYNHYGPTETTIGKLIHKVEVASLDTEIPLGKPFGNTQVYLLDENKKLVPGGIIGEICIAGEGVSEGYIKQEALTSERFISSPFDEKQIIYKTGDLAKWLDDGTLLFVGRKDEQVKINGYRVEQGEVENVLKSHPLVQDVAVICEYPANEKPSLGAFIIGKEKLNASELSNYLSRELPQYMMPGFYVQLEQFPLLGNGKIDKKALRNHKEGKLENQEQYVAPATEQEKALVEIWSEVLEKSNIGVLDNFFDLGGNSMKIIKMIHLVNKKFHTEIAIVSAFRYPNIQLLSQALIAEGQPPIVGISNAMEEEAVEIMDETLDFLNLDED